MGGPGRWMPWSEAWQQALYGDAGFYRRARPADHFRTSPLVSALFAQALVALARRDGLTEVVDLGAGDGELLAHLHTVAPDLRLTGVEVRERPAALPEAICWAPAVPPSGAALLVANELLDNITGEVVETDAKGTVRLVEIEPATGRERLADPPAPEQLAWLERWWPLDRPGRRAVVGRSRDDAWAAACARIQDGTCLAVDYGHLKGGRPAGGGLSSYQHGREAEVRPDGSRDVAASVAVDSVADRVGATLCSQATSLVELGVTGRRPPLRLAQTDPPAYLRALTAATEAAELTSPDGLGCFWWVLSRRGATLGSLR